MLPAEPGWEAPLAFFAALHYLVLAERAPALAAAYQRGGGAWPAAHEALVANVDFVRRFVRDQAVQTNEVLRSWALLPAFLTAAGGERTLDLIELGPSAGLNLCWDRFHYVYPGLEWGPQSPVVLEGEWRGPLTPALVDARVQVRGRVGIDRAPIDLGRADSALLLQSFVWPDQPDRLVRLRAAVEVWRSVRPTLVRGDYSEELEPRLAAADPDALTVIFSSASTEYLSDAEFERLADAIAAAGRRVSIAWISMEPDRGSGNYHDFFLDLREWPGETRRRLARVHYHGAWVEWQ